MMVGCYYATDCNLHATLYSHPVDDLNAQRDVARKVERDQVSGSDDGRIFPSSDPAGANFSDQIAPLLKSVRERKISATDEAGRRLRYTCQCSLPIIFSERIRVYVVALASNANDSGLTIRSRV